jgi:glutaminyl-peptide cyclotransferase
MLSRLTAALVLACAVHAATPQYTVQVVHTYPHDRTAFTEGLEFHDGLLYESTGLEGHSNIRVEELQTGKIIRRIDIPKQYFGEGITVLAGRLIELTWQTHLGFVYARSSLRLLSQFNFPGEGWGLTNDARHSIYMSDGTPQIRVWNSTNLREERRITVHDGDRPIERINELEWVRGEIFANVYGTDRIVRVSPVDGRVLGWINAGGLLTPQDQAQNVDVLNGIAYDARRNRLFVTGKLWPKLFEIKLIPQ